MTQRELTQADYIAILRRRWVLITVLAVVGAPLAYGVSRVLPNRYKSQTLVLIEPPTVPTDFVKPVITTEINARLASMQEEILSRTRLEPIIHQYGLYSGDVNRVPPDALVARLQKDIEITPIQPMAETRAQELPGFHIIVTLDNPQTAQEVCSAVTHMFIEESIRLRQQRSEDTTQFLAQQLVDAKAKLDEQDSKLAAFKSHYIGSLPDEEQSLNGIDFATRCGDTGAGAGATRQKLCRVYAGATGGRLASRTERQQSPNNGYAADSLANAANKSPSAVYGRLSGCGEN
jgi:uncharacterized protein involved in exopolysaccharide biosynthesis